MFHNRNIIQRNFLPKKIRITIKTVNNQNINFNIYYLTIAINFIDKLINLVFFPSNEK
jgi:hypothetical protein